MNLAPLGPQSTSKILNSRSFQLSTMLPQLVHHPWRSKPAEYYPSGHDEYGQFLPGMWLKNGLPHHVGVHKKHYHFIWPKDGKNGSKWGRFKDIMSGKGPDIHVTVGAKKMDYMHHRPRKPRWGLHDDLDGRGPDCHIRSPFPWVNKDRELGDKCYDFYTREFRRPYHGMWTDVHRHSKGGFHPWPKAVRDNFGDWWQDPAYVPFHLQQHVFGHDFQEGDIPTV